MNKIKFHKNYIFCFFSRNREYIKSNFSSLNCAYNKGDSDYIVRENRNFTSNYLNKKRIILPNQVHSNLVSNIKKTFYEDKYSDALVSNRKDILLGVLTADCAPIIVLGKKYYGIIHAGWKGLVNGIIENTIKRFISLGEKKKDLSVFVGPHLGKDSFEVKRDFVENIKQKIENYTNFIEKKSNKKIFNFTGLIESKLIDQKIINYDISKDNTYANPDKFFSHRYCCVNKIKNCGRQISLVGINNN